MKINNYFKIKGQINEGKQGQNKPEISLFKGQISPPTVTNVDCFDLRGLIVKPQQESQLKRKPEGPTVTLKHGEQE